MLEHASGFIDPALFAELNKQSQSVSIQDTFQADDIGLALNAADGFRFKDLSTITFKEYKTNAQLVISNHKDGLVSLCSLKSWSPSKTVDSVLNIGTHNAIVTSKSAECDENARFVLLHFSSNEWFQLLHNYQDSIENRISIMLFSIILENKILVILNV